MIRVLTLSLALGVCLLGSVDAADKKPKKGKKAPAHFKVNASVHTKIKGAGFKAKESIKIHERGRHTASAVVERGKIKTVVATRGGRAVDVTKFKSRVRLHAALPAAELSYFVSTEGRAAPPREKPGKPKDEVQSVGFGYFDDDDPDNTQWVIMWFAPDEVEGGDEGADEV